MAKRKNTMRKAVYLGTGGEKFPVIEDVHVTLEAKKALKKHKHENFA